MSWISVLKEFRSRVSTAIVRELAPNRAGRPPSLQVIARTFFATMRAAPNF
jgi:hypothetical protein